MVALPGLSPHCHHCQDLLLKLLQHHSACRSVSTCRVDWLSHWPAVDTKKAPLQIATWQNFLKVTQILVWESVILIIEVIKCTNHPDYSTSIHTCTCFVVWWHSISTGTGTVERAVRIPATMRASSIVTEALISVCNINQNVSSTPYRYQRTWCQMYKQSLLMHTNA